MGFDYSGAFHKRKREKQENILWWTIFYTKHLIPIGKVTLGLWLVLYDLKMRFQKKWHFDSATEENNILKQNLSSIF